MKKFVSILLSIVTAFGCFSFTACDLEGLDNVQVIVNSSQSSSSSSFEESSSSSEREEEELDDELVSWDSPIAQNGIGMTINAMEDEYIQTATGTEFNKIFNNQELYKIPLYKQTLAQQYQIVAEGTSMEKYYESFSNNVNKKFKISNSASVGVQGVFSAKVSNSFSQCFSEEIKNQKDSSTSEYYYSYQQTYNGYELWIDAYTNLNTFRNILSDSFLGAASAVTTEKEAAEFFNHYGTHLLTGGVFGGKINVSYGIVTNAMKITDEKTKTISSAISNSIGGSMTYDGVEVGGESSGGNELSVQLQEMAAFESEAMESQLEIHAVGGTAPMAGLTLDNFGEAFKNWAQTVPNNVVLIDVLDKSLVSLWDILPETAEYAVAKSVLNDYFTERCLEEYNFLLSKFSANTKGSFIDPYQISSEEEFIDFVSDDKKNADGVYVELTKDLDFSTYDNWGSKAKDLHAHFNGNNHIVSGINIALEGYQLEDDYKCGLFKTVYGNVSNLKIERCNFGWTANQNGAAEFYCGALCGVLATSRVNNVHISNCTFDIRRYLASIGGIAGYAEEVLNISQCAIENCIFYTYGYTGGIIGRISDEGNITISDCQAKSSAISLYTETENRAWGFILGQASNSKIYSCEVDSCNMYFQGANKNMHAYSIFGEHWYCKLQPMAGWIAGILSKEGYLEQQSCVVSNCSVSDKSNNANSSWSHINNKGKNESRCWFTRYDGMVGYQEE